ncbi:hypothetical protein N5U17_09170 [Aliarcobacter butzleri]|uniref:hypothetical protein n=1 Tax=Aliarcobacter butzleri TaxID=28197 RepID=UPI0021B167A9|nr:hypothetical protein [Aliarcobacter butzleri]MCT7604406.1 hypothetical protein [Aliarcobacter butzleri]
MKFKHGDLIDDNLCTALTHEYYRCNDSFNQFSFYSNLMIFQGETPEISYKAYNAYSDFIHHLYEFYVGCFSRDILNTEIINNKKVKAKLIDNYITRHTQRILNNYKDMIINGIAPSWINGLNYYNVEVPTNFASNFRTYRNKISGHVSYKRSSELSLSEFYKKYHKFLYLLYYDAKHWWGNKNEKFPDLKEITEFTIMLKTEKK